MPRTEHLKPYMDRIDALNDQLWYFLFTSEELNRQLDNYSPSVKEKYTTELFAANKHAFRIRVKVSALKKHQDNNKRITYGAYISTAYEVASNYLKEVFDFLKSINSLPHYDWKKSIPPELNLQSLFSSNGIATYPAHIIDAFSYLRLRRNHFTHLMPLPNFALSNFMATSGAGLETAWKTSGVVSHLNFTTLTITNEFSLEETIEMFKLLRICVIEIDEFVSSVVNKDELIKFIATREFGTMKTRMNNDILTQRVHKIISVANFEFGTTITNIDCEPFAKTIGVK